MVDLLLSSFQFLEECIAGFVKSDFELKHLCLEYMAPWLPNLARLVYVDLVSVQNWSQFLYTGFFSLNRG